MRLGVCLEASRRACRRIRQSNRRPLRPGRRHRDRLSRTALRLCRRALEILRSIFQSGLIWCLCVPTRLAFIWRAMVLARCVSCIQAQMDRRCASHRVGRAQIGISCAPHAINSIRVGRGSSNTFCWTTPRTVRSCTGLESCFTHEWMWWSMALWFGGGSISIPLKRLELQRKLRIYWPVASVARQTRIQFSPANLLQADLLQPRNTSASVRAL